jgi:hypothetical protein
MGFNYVDKDDLITLPHLQRLERLEALLLSGLENDATARAAMLGTQAQPSFSLSKVFVEYEAITKEETRKFSPNQLRAWRNSRIHA